MSKFKAMRLYQASRHILDAYTDLLWAKPQEAEELHQVWDKLYDQYLDALDGLGLTPKEHKAWIAEYERSITHEVKWGEQGVDSAFNV